jgi:hypothetical protein
MSGYRLARLAAVAAISLLPIAPNVVQAQSPQVERIAVFDAGIYCADTVQKVSDPTAPGGYRNVVVNQKLMRHTDQIPALIGTRFGMRYTIVGSPDGAPVDLRLVTRLPPPGLREPSGRVILVNEYNYGSSIGTNGYREYHIEYDWEALTGVWVFELWANERKFAEQPFNLFKPQPGQKGNAPCAPVVGSLTVPKKVLAN